MREDALTAAFGHPGIAGVTVGQRALFIAG